MLSLIERFSWKLSLREVELGVKFKRGLVGKV